MRVTSLSLGLAVIALVAAQADPMAPTDPMAPAGAAAQPTYDWASVGDENQLVALVEDLSYQISERALRAQMHKNPFDMAPASMASGQFVANAGVCDAAAGTLTTLVGSAVGGLTSFGGVLGGPIASMLDKFIGPIKALVNVGSISTIATTVVTAIGVAITFLKSISIGPLQVVITPLVSILETIRDAIRNLLICKVSGGAGGTGEIPDIGKIIGEIGGIVGGIGGIGGLATKIDLESCSLLADIYRDSLIQAAEAYAKLPKDQAEELQRYLDGAAALTENASKTSVASTNDALLASRPIFSADVLEQYRAEIIRKSNNNDDIRVYAIADLGSIVAFSNGLEACLRIAADPAAAAEETNEDEEEDYEDDEDEE